MRLFSSAVEAVKEVERDLWEMGHRLSSNSVQDKIGNVEFMELTAYSFTILDASVDWHKTFETLGFDDYEECINYVQEEFRDRMILKGPNPGFSWTERRDLWSQYLHEGKFSYTYGDRFVQHFETDQIEDLDLIHTMDPHSRQMILQVYDQKTDGKRRLGIKRIPCTVYYQLLDRNGVLTMIHNMRSCDLYKHFPIDLSVSWKIVERLAEEWKLTPRLVLQIGSLHAFRKDMEKRKIF